MLQILIPTSFPFNQPNDSGQFAERIPRLSKKCASFRRMSTVKITMKTWARHRPEWSMASPYPARFVRVGWHTWHQLPYGLAKLCGVWRLHNAGWNPGPTCSQGLVTQLYMRNLTQLVKARFIYPEKWIVSKPRRKVVKLLSKCEGFLTDNRWADCTCFEHGTCMPVCKKTTSPLECKPV